MAAFFSASFLVLLGFPSWKMWWKPSPLRYNLHWQGDDSERFNWRYSKSVFWIGRFRPRSTGAHPLKIVLGHFPCLHLTKWFAKSCFRFLWMILSWSVSCHRMELSLEQAQLPGQPRWTTWFLCFVSRGLEASNSNSFPRSTFSWDCSEFTDCKRKLHY